MVSEGNTTMVDAFLLSQERCSSLLLLDSTSRHYGVEGEAFNFWVLGSLPQSNRG